MSFKFDYKEQRYFFLCDKCEKIENVAIKPEGWVDGSTSELFKESVEETFQQMYGDKAKYDKYHYYEYGDFHFCIECVRKQEIREVFK